MATMTKTAAKMNMQAGQADLDGSDSHPTLAKTREAMKSTANADGVDRPARGISIRQMQPEVTGLSREAAAGLTAEQRKQVERVLSEQVEFITHESFFADFEHSEFAKPVGTIARTGLTPDQERRLFLQFNHARYRVYRIVADHSSKAISLETARELLEWHDKSNDMRNQLTAANVPLVLAMAKRTRMKQVDHNDLVSEGNMALLRSIDKFDVSRGYKFSTYACRAILKAFSRTATKASNYRARFPVEFDPALERSDWAEIKSEQESSEYASELRTILQENLAGLTDVEQQVISARFSLPMEGTLGNTQTLEQVGVAIGLTKERVRQIQKKALAKLRTTLEDGAMAA